MSSPSGVCQQADEPAGTTPDSDGTVVVRNFSVLMVAQFVSCGIAIAGAIIIPRYLGAELLGRLHVSNSLWQIGIVVASFGMNLLIGKQIARAAGETGPMLATTAVRLLFLIPTAAAIFGYALLADYPSQTLIRNDFILLTIAAGAVVYLIMVIVLRLVDSEDRQLVTSAVGSALASRRGRGCQ